MNLSEILSEGPKSYTELRGNLHPEAFDSILRSTLKARKVVRLANGKYSLPVKPETDEDLPSIDEARRQAQREAYDDAKRARKREYYKRTRQLRLRKARENYFKRKARRENSIERT